jgi:hypothetical protein
LKYLCNNLLTIYTLLTIQKQIDPVAAKSKFYMKCGDLESAESRAGRELFEDINVYAELMENCRFRDLTASPLASFNKTARIGQPDVELLDAINARVQINADYESLFHDYGPLHPTKRDNGHKILCLAGTWKVVNEINDAAFHSLRKTKQHYRMWATHTEENRGPVTPTEAAH